MSIVHEIMIDSLVLPVFWANHQIYRYLIQGLYTVREFETGRIHLPFTAPCLLNDQVMVE